MMLMEGCMKGCFYRLRRPKSQRCDNRIVTWPRTKSHATENNRTVVLCEIKGMTMDLLPLSPTTIECEESGSRMENIVQLDDRMSAPGVRVSRNESRAGLGRQVSRFLREVVRERRNESQARARPL